MAPQVKKKVKGITSLAGLVRMRSRLHSWSKRTADSVTKQRLALMSIFLFPLVVVCFGWHMGSLLTWITAVAWFSKTALNRYRCQVAVAARPVLLAATCILLYFTVSFVLRYKWTIMGVCAVFLLVVDYLVNAALAVAGKHTFGPHARIQLSWRSQTLTLRNFNVNCALLRSVFKISTFKPRKVAFTELKIRLPVVDLLRGCRILCTGLDISLDFIEPRENKFFLDPAFQEQAFNDRQAAMLARCDAQTKIIGTKLDAMQRALEAQRVAEETAEASDSNDAEVIEESSRWMKYVDAAVASFSFEMKNLSVRINGLPGNLNRNFERNTSALTAKLARLALQCSQPQVVGRDSVALEAKFEVVVESIAAGEGDSMLNRFEACVIAESSKPCSSFLTASRDPVHLALKLRATRFDVNLHSDIVRPLLRLAAAQSVLHASVSNAADTYQYQLKQKPWNASERDEYIRIYRRLCSPETLRGRLHYLVHALLGESSGDIIAKRRLAALEKRVGHPETLMDARHEALRWNIAPAEEDPLDGASEELRRSADREAVLMRPIPTSSKTTTDLKAEVKWEGLRIYFGKNLQEAKLHAFQLNQLDASTRLVFTGGSTTSVGGKLTVQDVFLHDRRISRVGGLGTILSFVPVRGKTKTSSGHDITASFRHEAGLPFSVALDTNDILIVPIFTSIFDLISSLEEYNLPSYDQNISVERARQTQTQTQTQTSYISRAYADPKKQTGLFLGGAMVNAEITSALAVALPEVNDKRRRHVPCILALAHIDIKIEASNVAEKIEFDITDIQAVDALCSATIGRNSSPSINRGSTSILQFEGEGVDFRTTISATFDETTMTTRREINTGAHRLGINISPSIIAAISKMLSSFEFAVEQDKAQRDAQRKIDAEVYAEFDKRLVARRLKILEEQFKMIDKDGSNNLDREEFRSFLLGQRSMSEILSRFMPCEVEHAIVSLMDRIDIDGDGYINWSEFSSALMSPQFQQDKELLQLYCSEYCQSEIYFSNAKTRRRMRSSVYKIAKLTKLKSFSESSAKKQKKMHRQRSKDNKEHEKLNNRKARMHNDAMLLRRFKVCASTSSSISKRRLRQNRNKKISSTLASFIHLKLLELENVSKLGGYLYGNFLKTYDSDIRRKYGRKTKRCLLDSEDTKRLWFVLGKQLRINPGSVEFAGMEDLQCKLVRLFADWSAARAIWNTVLRPILEESHTREGQDAIDWSLLPNTIIPGPTRLESTLFTDMLSPHAATRKTAEESLVHTSSTVTVRTEFVAQIMGIMLRFIDPLDADTGSDIEISVVRPNLSLLMIQWSDSDMHRGISSRHHVTKQDSVSSREDDYLRSSYSENLDPCTDSDESASDSDEEDWAYNSVHSTRDRFHLAYSGNFTLSIYHLHESLSSMSPLLEPCDVGAKYPSSEAGGDLSIAISNIQINASARAMKLITRWSSTYSREKHSASQLSQQELESTDNVDFRFSLKLNNLLHHHRIFGSVGSSADTIQQYLHYKPNAKGKGARRSSQIFADNIRISKNDGDVAQVNEITTAEDQAESKLCGAPQHAERGVTSVVRSRCLQQPVEPDGNFRVVPFVLEEDSTGSKYRKDIDISHMQTVFTAADADNSGFLDQDEVEKLVEQELLEYLSPSHDILRKMREVLENLLQNKNRRPLNFAEFIEIMDCVRESMIVRDVLYICVEGFTDIICFDTNRKTYASRLDMGNTTCLIVCDMSEFAEARATIRSNVCISTETGIDIQCFLQGKGGGEDEGIMTLTLEKHEKVWLPLTTRSFSIRSHLEDSWSEQILIPDMINNSEATFLPTTTVFNCLLVNRLESQIPNRGGFLKKKMGLRASASNAPMMDYVFKVTSRVTFINRLPFATTFNFMTYSVNELPGDVSQAWKSHSAWSMELCTGETTSLSCKLDSESIMRIRCAPSKMREPSFSGVDGSEAVFLCKKDNAFCSVEVPCIGRVTFDMTRGAEEGTFIFSASVEFWIVNRTGLRLQYEFRAKQRFNSWGPRRERVDHIGVDHEMNDVQQPGFPVPPTCEILAFDHPRHFHSSRSSYPTYMRIRLLDESVPEDGLLDLDSENRKETLLSWSNRENISVVGKDTVFDVRNLGNSLSVICVLRSMPGVLSTTTLVQLEAPIFVENKLHEDIFLRFETGRRHPKMLVLQPKKVGRLFCSTDTPRVQIGSKGHHGMIWSKTLDVSGFIDEDIEFEFRADLVVKIHVAGVYDGHSGKYIILERGNATFKVENRSTRVPVWCSAGGSQREGMMLLPLESRVFALSANQSSVVCLAVPNSDQHFGGATESKEKDTFLTRVDFSRLGKHHDMVVKRGDLITRLCLEVYMDGEHKVLSLSDSALLTSSIHASAIKWGRSAALSKSKSIQIGRLALLLLDEHPRELMELSFEEICAMYDAQKTEFSILHAQLDDLTVGSQTPVIIEPTDTGHNTFRDEAWRYSKPKDHNSKRGAKDARRPYKRLKPWLKISATKLPTLSMTLYDRCIIDIGDLYANIDIKYILVDVIDYYTREIPVIFAMIGYPLLGNIESVREILLWAFYPYDGFSATYGTSVRFFQTVTINTCNLSLRLRTDSLHASRKEEIKSVSSDAAKGYLLSLGPSVETAPCITFSRRTFYRFKGNWLKLFGRYTSLAFDSVYGKLFDAITSMKLFGDLGGLARSVKMSARTSKALVKRKKFGLATARMTQAVVGGCFGALGASSESVLEGISKISGRKKPIYTNYPSHLLHGVGQGVLAFGGSLLRGVGGVFTRPFFGARRHGVIGFFRGIRQGLVGLLCMVPIAYLSFLERVYKGITAQLQAFQPLHVAGTRRPPRLLVDAETGKSLRLFHLAQNPYLATHVTLRIHCGRNIPVGDVRKLRRRKIFVRVNLYDKRRETTFINEIGFSPKSTRQKKHKMQRFRTRVTNLCSNPVFDSVDFSFNLTKHNKLAEDMQRGFVVGSPMLQFKIRIKVYEKRTFGKRLLASTELGLDDVVRLFPCRDPHPFQPRPGRCVGMRANSAWNLISGSEHRKRVCESIKGHIDLVVRRRQLYDGGTPTSTARSGNTDAHSRASRDPKAQGQKLGEGKESAARKNSETGKMKEFHHAEEKMRSARSRSPVRVFSANESRAVWVNLTPSLLPNRKADVSGGLTLSSSGGVDQPALSISGYIQRFRDHSVKARAAKLK